MGTRLGARKTKATSASAIDPIPAKTAMLIFHKCHKKALPRGKNVQNELWTRIYSRLLLFNKSHPRQIAETAAVNLRLLLRLVFLGSIFMSHACTTRTAEPLRTEPIAYSDLTAPPASDWLMTRRTYNGWAFSPLKQIDTRNVRQLIPVWVFPTGKGGGHEAPPIVRDGIMYIAVPGDGVLALDVRRRKLLWEYRHDLPTAAFPTNRGVALAGSEVILGTFDCRVVALDRQTGKRVWQSTLCDWRKGYYINMAPLVVRNTVMIGTSGGDNGVNCFLVGLDSRSGARLWRFDLVPPPGHFGHQTWPGQSWLHGGVAMYMTGSYDPIRNEVLWGTGNPTPWVSDGRSGRVLFSDSVIALNPDSGRLIAYYQYHADDEWDWDEVGPPFLITVNRSGTLTPELVHPGRDGYLWQLKRVGDDQIRFISATRFVYQDVYSKIDPISGQPSYSPNSRYGVGTSAWFCPSVDGGTNWFQGSYSPLTRLLYIPANENVCSKFTGVKPRYEIWKPYFGIEGFVYSVRPGATHIGELQAWSLETGRRVWKHELGKSVNFGPVLSTAGNLVFTGGTSDGKFRAFDARTGKQLWEYVTRSGIISPPVAFSVGDTEYIAVVSGWGAEAERFEGFLEDIHFGKNPEPGGAAVYVFALK